MGAAGSLAGCPDPASYDISRHGFCTAPPAAPTEADSFEDRQEDPDSLLGGELQVEDRCVNDMLLDGSLWESPLDAAQFGSFLELEETGKLEDYEENARSANHEVNQEDGAWWYGKLLTPRTARGPQRELLLRRVSNKKPHCAAAKIQEVKADTPPR